MAESHYIIRGGVKGRERLRLLAEVMRPTTLGLFERIGVRSGMRCLDVGCGGGDVTFELARLVGAAGWVVGLDMDETKLELARQEATAQQLGNVEFRRAEIGIDDLELGFDAVYSRFLLTHLPQPMAALAKMCEALGSGGVLVVEDIDMSGSFSHPASAAFEQYVELYTQAARRSGADPNIGPRLPRMLAEVGLAGVQMNIVQPAGMEGEVKLVAPVTMENIADALLTAGLASRSQIDHVISELLTIAHDVETVVSVPRVVQAWGHRAA